MTDRLEEIRAWREEVKDAERRFPLVLPDGAPYESTSGDAIDDLLAEVERLRAALDTEKEANATGWRRAEAKTAEIERLQCEIELVKNAAIPAETKAWKRAAMEHYDSAQRWAKDWAASAEREQNALAEVERLRAALREYADPENWGQDDWGVVAIFAPDYGTPGQTAIAALTEGGDEAPVMRATLPDEPLRALTIKGARKEIAKRAALTDGGES